MEANSNAIGTCVLSQQVSADIDTDGLPIVFHVTNDFAVIALDNGQVQVFDIDGTMRKSWSTLQGAIWALAVQENVLASGGSDGTIKIWDIATGDHQKTLLGHTSTIRALTILSDTSRIISASRDTTIRIWELAEGKCTGVMTTHTKTVRTLALSRAGDLLVSGSQDGTACVCRITDEGILCLHQLQQHEGVVYCAVFAEVVSTRVVTGGADGCVRIWDPETGKCQAVLQGHGTVVNRVIVAGSKLVSADASGWIYIWSMSDTPELIHQLKTHRLSIMSLAWDGIRLLSGGKEGSVKLRDVQSGRLLGQLEDPARKIVWKVAFLGVDTVVVVFARERTAVMEMWKVTQG